MFISVVILIVRIAFECQWIKWILRVFFMVNIILPILPVRKFSWICAHSDHWSIAKFPNFTLFGLTFHFKRIKVCFISRRHVHSMWVYYFMFFLNIKAWIRWNYQSSLWLFNVFFLINSRDSFRVRVSDETIRAPRSSSNRWTTFSWVYFQLLNRKNFLFTVSLS